MIPCFGPFVWDYYCFSFTKGFCLRVLVKQQHGYKTISYQWFDQLEGLSINSIECLDLLDTIFLFVCFLFSGRILVYYCLSNVFLIYFYYVWYVLNTEVLPDISNKKHISDRKLSFKIVFYKIESNFYIYFFGEVLSGLHEHNWLLVLNTLIVFFWGETRWSEYSPCTHSCLLSFLVSFRCLVFCLRHSLWVCDLKRSPTGRTDLKNMAPNRMCADGSWDGWLMLTYFCSEKLHIQCLSTRSSSSGERSEWDREQVWLNKPRHDSMISLRVRKGVCMTRSC